MNPLLSIIIPSYNYAHFLPYALDSVLKQEFMDFEVLLIDDGSTDNSHELSVKYSKKDKRVRYIHHKTNRGLFVRVNEGLALAKGTYIHFFSADDVYSPGFLSKLMQEFQKNPELGLVCCDIAYFQDNSDRFDVKHLLKRQEKPIFYSPQELINLFQETDFWVPGSTCIVKKELIFKHEGHTPLLENISDWFLFHRIALFEGVAYVPETLFSMRVHEQTYTRQVKKCKARRRKTYWELLKYLEKKKEIRDKFKQAALLSFVFKELSWKLLLQPKYWSYIPSIRRKQRQKNLLL